MMASQKPARASLTATLAEAKASRTPEAGQAVRRLQAVAGTVSTGDRTADQVRAQLAGFGCDAYEVQPIPPKGVEGLGRERIRKWTADQMLKGLGWLKRMNALGYDIFIRPAAPTEHTAQPFAFVDDINQATIDRMVVDGYPFAVLNESSPGRFHGWVRIASQPLDRDEVSRAGRMLAETYGADPNSADWRHYGRVAGTTNRKPSRMTTKGAPFVMLRGSAGGLAPGAENLLSMARESLDYDARAAAKAHAETMNAYAFRDSREPREDAGERFLAARAAATPTRADDESARDFSGAMSLLRRGYSADQVARTIRESSPGLEDRHADAETYIRRTVERAAERVASTPSTGLQRPK